MTSAPMPLRVRVPLFRSCSGRRGASQMSKHPAPQFSRVPLART